jgi:hypothetical protein
MSRIPLALGRIGGHAPSLMRSLPGRWRRDRSEILAGPALPGVLADRASIALGARVLTVRWPACRVSLVFVHQDEYTG